MCIPTEGEFALCEFGVAHELGAPQIETSFSVGTPDVIMQRECPVIEQRTPDHSFYHRPFSACCHIIPRIRAMRRLLHLGAGYITPSSDPIPTYQRIDLSTRSRSVAYFCEATATV